VPPVNQKKGSVQDFKAKALLAGAQGSLVSQSVVEGDTGYNASRLRTMAAARIFTGSMAFDIGRLTPRPANRSLPQSLLKAIKLANH
jgi:hypothetical protein